MPSASRLRAKGVMSFQASSAVVLAISASRRSAGNLWTTPPGTRWPLIGQRYGTPRLVLVARGPGYLVRRVPAGDAAAADTPTPGLLERDSELHTIDRRIASARAGAGSLVVVEGPAGAGKTVLLAAARERAEHAGMRVLHARGGQLEREFSFGVARQMFESLLLRATPGDRDALLDGAAAASAPLIGATAQPALHNAADAGADAAFQALHGLFWLRRTSPPVRR